MILQPVAAWPRLLALSRFALRRIATRMASNDGTEVTEVREGVLLGLGNPLLDIEIRTDARFLRKYDLEPDNAIPAKDQHKKMFDEMISRHNPEYLPGGATQNTIRVAQWLLKTPRATTMFGCVGDDKMAEILRKKAEEVGVNVRYQVNRDSPTGVCAAIVTGEDNRSLVSSLGAARLFSDNFLRQPDNWELVTKADYYYIGGFFFPVSPESIEVIAKHACEANKTLVMNLSATFLCRYFSKSDFDILSYVDILVANEGEAETLASQLGWETTDIHDIAFKLMELPKKNAKRGRMVLFTHGSCPLTVARDGQLEKYEIEPIPHAQIKDANGCGDAFMGGFLAKLIQGADVIECIRYGNCAASTVLQYWGCSFPDTPEFD